MNRHTRAFTTVEILAAVGILVITLVALSEVFNITTETAARTAAHEEVIAASAAIQERLTTLLSKIEPGMLIIESPTPAGSQTLRADIPGGPQLFRLRHDRLVFVASGDGDEFQSFSDPRRGTPDTPRAEPAKGSEALIYFGPGAPLTTTGNPNKKPRPFDDDSYYLAGAEWILAQRSILFLLDPPSPAVANWVPSDMTIFTGAGMMLHGGHFWPQDQLTPELKPYVTGAMDAVVSGGGYRATAGTLVDLFQALDLNNLLSATPDAAALWEPSWCPTVVTLVDPVNALDYYTRTGANFQPRVADFRVDWTDGRRVDPTGVGGTVNWSTRWFGMRLDQSSVGSTGGLAFTPVRRGDNAAETTNAEAEAFGIGGGMNTVEWSNVVGGASSTTAAYRAVWRKDTWAFRPKALRISYRIYDSGNRLVNEKGLIPGEDGWPDANDPVAYKRYGQLFTVVIPLP